MITEKIMDLYNKGKITDHFEYPNSDYEYKTKDWYCHLIKNK